MMSITRKQFIDHAVLPGLGPRLKDMFASGFHYIPFFLALVYQAVRLLPANHPYLNAQNIGHFGMRNVIAEAANNLVLSAKNIDQLVLFVTILFGVVIILLQLGALALAIFSGPVMASMPTNFAGFFITPNPSQDLAFIMLDLVFGVPGIFDSCVATGVDCLLDVKENGGATLEDPWITGGLGFPFPIHTGLHQMFQLYSFGLLAVGALILVYFIITIIAETAQTGTAFGKRFNKVWAPVRLAVAFGLLIPVGFGLNSSQFIVLYAAKLGSGFATNGWIIFNDALIGAYSGTDNSALGKTQTLVSRPNIPDIGGLLQFMFVARTCAEMYEQSNHDFPATGALYKIEPYLVRDPIQTPSFLIVTDTGGGTGSYGNANKFLPYDGTPDSLIGFANGSTSVTIRFGYEDPNRHGDEKGGVTPKCGELTIPLSDPRDPQASQPEHKPEIAPEVIQRYFWYLIQELWYVHFYNDTAFGENFPKNFVQKYYNKDSSAVLPKSEFASGLIDFFKKDLAILLDGEPYGVTNIESWIPEATASMGAPVEGIINKQATSPTWAAHTTELTQKGWAGAGIWYNKIAELNGVVSTAMQALPTPARFPWVMEEVKKKKEQYDADIKLTEMFRPILADNKDVPLGDPEDQIFQPLLYEAFSYWTNANVTSSWTTVTGNALVDAINALLGTEGLYSMRRNADVHPLAQLVGIGRSLIEASIRNLTISVGGAGASAILGEAIDKNVGTLGSTAIGFLMTIVTISMTVGFVLFYVIPFLPFIYFFFAVGGWVKGIFEAMVGAPLWALAHIRIDGNGLSGQAAVNGYFLIFEIFLRPILIVFGFLASISIFSALVMMLNQTWDIVVVNLAGFDALCEAEIAGAVGDGCDSTTIGATSLIESAREPIDEFLFTVMYAMIVYMMAMSSFKLIDLIPNNILRWMGQSVATFNDSRDDPAQGLLGTATMGSQQVTRGVGGGLSNALTGAASSGGKG